MNKIINARRYDKRRKYYLVLDCETATLPCAQNYPADQKQIIALAKPLVYDLGWTVIDRHGNIYSRKNFLITEIFSVPEIFNTAYYAEKRPIYIDKLKKGEIILADWKTATLELEKDLQVTESVGAYNSFFDYKKAIPFTELYISFLYSNKFQLWMDFQEQCCEELATKKIIPSKIIEEKSIFRFHGIAYPLFDLWGLACKYILNVDDYKSTCVSKGWQTASGRFFKTSAETTYRYISGHTNFDEAHTAVDDAEIESEIFVRIARNTKNKFELGIIVFPFQILGTVENFKANKRTP